MNLLHPTLIPLALVMPGLSASPTTDTDGLFIAQHHNVLGTSFDLKLVARSYTAAQRAETALFAEINRLSAILSSYQTTSEFSQWGTTYGRAVPVSADLLNVLTGFDHWREQTDGRINAAAETINQLWQRAAEAQVLPTTMERADAVEAVQQQHWQLDLVAQTATRLSRIPLRLHTFAKSYILDRAANQALAVADVRAVVLNSGGDLVVRGDWTESVAVANPRAAAENDQPLDRLFIQNRAVATSGNYRRGVRIGEDWFSHIVDPLTGNPAHDVISATVIHPDAQTAGALATAFNVLPPADSIRLASTLPGTDYLIITRDGQPLTSPTWHQFRATSFPENPGPSVGRSSISTTAQLLSVAPQKDKLWNPDQELLISFDLSQIEGRSRRPFVAVWVEDQNRVPVRQIALWYNKPRWLPELRAWYSQQRNADIDATSIASATRSPGSYSLKWDGKNDQGQYVKQGKYTICIEAAREHGTYQLMRQEMDFNGKPKQQTLSGNVEIATAALDYRKAATDR